MVKAPPAPFTDLLNSSPSQKQQSSPTRSFVLDVSGMKCASCVRAVEKQLIEQEGVLNATVNLVTEVAVVEAEDSTKVNPKDWANRLTQSGFPSQLRDSVDGTAQGSAGLTDWLARKQKENQAQIQQLTIALILLALSTLGHLHHFGWFTIPVLSDLWFHGLLATATLLFPARQILLDGWRGVQHGTPNMNTLVALGALSAYGASIVALLFPALGWECFFDEPVMLLSFILLGRTLEQRARFRATDALRSLIALQPTNARLIGAPQSDGVTQPGVEVPVSAVQVGEWLQVLPGETIPADGEVVVGQTTVDESMLTGESIPVGKLPGETVTAGTVNQTGAIALKITGTGKDTVLAQMIHLVELAQTRKAPMQRLADVIAGYFTYGVLLVAVLTFAFWYFAGLNLWPDALSSALGPMHVHHQMTMQSSAVLASLKRAIAVLVVACPCALGLATPTAILVGSGIGADQGLLIRGGDVLEALSRVDTVVFDKTGTLTQGVPQVTICQVLNEAFTEADFLRIAAAVESGTQHPLAIAIQQAAQAQALTLPSATNFQTQAGLGVSATVLWDNQPQSVLIGSANWLSKHDVDIPENAAVAMTQISEDQTAVYGAIAGRLVGVVAIADTLRLDAPATLKALKQKGLAIHLLTGDRTPVAKAVAKALGIPADHVISEVLPADKSRVISDLQADGHCVALVGDGINDAPALAQADVGISLSSGTDIATEAADVVLMGDRLTEIPSALRLGQATVAKIRQNLAWAFAYNLICVPVAAGVLLPAYNLSLSPAVAGGFMALSSVAVVTNSLLLKTQWSGLGEEVK